MIIPQLSKGVQNSLLNKFLHFKQDEADKVASWSPITIDGKEVELTKDAKYFEVQIQG